MSGMVCPKDGWEMELDLETHRASLNEGSAVELYRCRLGHSFRKDKPAQLPSEGEIAEDVHRVVPCAVCGALFQRVTGTQRYCRSANNACLKLARKDRDRCDREGVPWILEERPWYRGLGSEQKLQRTEGYMLGAQRDWMEGYRRSYGD